MNKNKPKIAIITESLRRDNQKPLQYFNQIRVLHFYHCAPYGNETKEDFKDAIKFDGASDLYKKIISSKPDIIQGTEPYGSKKMFAYSVVSYLASKKLHIPLIFPFWENRPPEKRFNFFQRIIVNWFARIYIKHAAKIIYINNGALKNIKKLVKNINQDKLIKFLWGTWGVDIDEFKPQNNAIKLNQNTILFVGRIVYEKGIKYLMPALKKLHERFPSTRLVIIGDGDLIDYVKEYRDKNNLKQFVDLKGNMPNRELPKYLQRAALFVSPAVTIDTWEEQVGMTNIQAMACGVPVVSTNSGGIPEYVPNKIAGFLVRQKDIDRLASAMISLIDNDKLRKRISVQAREYSLKNYDARQNILKAQDIILKILDDKQN